MRPTNAALVLTSCFLCACGGPAGYAEREGFAADTRYHRDFQIPAPQLCEAAQRVLLGGGYVVTEGQGPRLRVFGAKEFQKDEKSHAIVHVYVTCDAHESGATLYVTATEEHFDVNTRRESSFFGLPVVAPPSFGTQTETDWQVKTHGETVTEQGFYENFYRAVQRQLPR